MLGKWYNVGEEGDAMFHENNMMNWILLWAVLAVPYFVYEGTVLQYNLSMICGFDPVTVVVVLLVFVPFIGTIIQSMRN